MKCSASNCSKRTARLLNEKWDFAVPYRGNGSYEIGEAKAVAAKRPTSIMFFRAKNPHVVTRLRSINFKKMAAKNAVTIGWFGYGNVVKEYEAITASAANDI